MFYIPLTEVQGFKKHKTRKCRAILPYMLPPMTSVFHKDHLFFQYNYVDLDFIMEAVRSPYRNNFMDLPVFLCDVINLSLLH